jgi:hypothetical protein
VTLKPPLHAQRDRDLLGRPPRSASRPVSAAFISNSIAWWTATCLTVAKWSVKNRSASRSVTSSSSPFSFSRRVRGFDQWAAIVAHCVGCITTMPKKGRYFRPAKVLVTLTQEPRSRAAARGRAIHCTAILHLIMDDSEGRSQLDLGPMPLLARVKRAGVAAPANLPSLHRSAERAAQRPSAAGSRRRLRRTATTHSLG